MKVNTKFFSKIILIFVFLISALFYLNAYADGQGIWAGTECARGSERGGPIRSCDLCDAFIVAKNILDILIKFAFIIGGIMILVGGATMLVSAGRPDLIKKGRNTIIKAGIGITIVLTSYLIVGTIIHILSGRPDFPWNRISCERKDYVATGGENNNIASGGPLYFKIANDGRLACHKSKEELKKIHPQNGTIYQFNNYGKFIIPIDRYDGKEEIDNKLCGAYLVPELNSKRNHGGQYSISETYFYYEKIKNTDTSTIFYYSEYSCNFEDVSVQESDCRIVYYEKCLALENKETLPSISCSQKIVKPK